MARTESVERGAADWGCDQDSFVRMEWGTKPEGALSGDEFFAIGSPDVALGKLEALWGPRVRW
jgi:hypothetical protein